MRVLPTLLAVAALLLGTAASAAQPARSDEEVYEELRRMALTALPADLGITVQGTQPAVYGIVMDMDMEGWTATLVAFSTGDASLYLSNGGMMTGGIDHPNVAAASRDFVAAAGPHLPAMAAARRHPRPGRGQINFYVLTTAGLLGATRSTDLLAAATDAFSPLFMAGQRVIAEFRLVEPQR